jgi:hypothetical protein
MEERGAVVQGCRRLEVLSGLQELLVRLAAIIAVLFPLLLCAKSERCKFGGRVCH